MARGKYEYWLTADGLLLLEAYARDGLTDDQIAQNMGITRSTLSSWKVKHPSLSESLKRGKRVVDVQVENALLKRALGFEYQEVKNEEGVDVDGCTYSKVVKTTKKVVPDTTAQIFWLKNREPKKWNGQAPNQINQIGNTSPDNIKKTLLLIADMVASGEMDVKKANTLITACNAVLSAIRTDDQQKKISELERILNELQK